MYAMEPNRAGKLGGDLSVLSCGVARIHPTPVHTKLKHCFISVRARC